MKGHTSCTARARDRSSVVSRLNGLSGNVLVQTSLGATPLDNRCPRNGIGRDPLGGLVKPIRWVIMATVFRIGSYRIVVYSNDHSPAHVHAVGPDGIAKISLGSAPSEVALVECDGIGAADLRRILGQVIDRHADCLNSWLHYHGH